MPTSTGAICGADAAYEVRWGGERTGRSDKQLLQVTWDSVPGRGQGATYVQVNWEAETMVARRGGREEDGMGRHGKASSEQHLRPKGDQAARRTAGRQEVVASLVVFRG